MLFFIVYLNSSFVILSLQCSGALCSTVQKTRRQGQWIVRLVTKWALWQQDSHGRGYFARFGRFCSECICVEVDWYLCDNVFVFLCLWVKIVALSLVLPRAKLGSDGNTQLETNWWFVKLGNRNGRKWRKGNLFLFVLPRSTTLVQGQSFTLTCVVAASASANEWSALGWYIIAHHSRKCVWRLFREELTTEVAGDDIMMIKMIMTMTMVTQISLFIGESAPSHGWPLTLSMHCHNPSSSYAPPRRPTCIIVIVRSSSSSLIIITHIQYSSLSLYTSWI